MQHLAGESGGINFVIHKMEDIDAIMAKIGISMHNQYLLGYYTPERCPQRPVPQDCGRVGGARRHAAPLSSGTVGILRTVRGRSDD
jgi:hypothetical protein